MRAPLRATDRQLAQQSYCVATAATAAPGEPGARYPALAEPNTCDVAVVGGGLAGLSAALELAGRGFNVVRLEAHEIGWGASGRNGGQANHGLACDQSTIEAQLGLDKARRIWAMSLKALDLLRQRIPRHAIDCEWRDGYLGLATTPGKDAALARWADALIPSRAAVCNTNLVLDYFRTTNDHHMLYGGRVSYSTRTSRRLAQSMQARMVQTFAQLAGVLVAETMAGDAQRFDVYARLRHRRFPGGRLMRTPALVLGMGWARLRDMLG